MSLRIIFMGTPDFAVPVLQRLLEGPHQVIAVYTQPPRPAGRGQAERPGAVHRLATQAGLRVFTPASLRDDEARREFAGLRADVAAVVAYGQILPGAVLDAPRFGCINVHASLLPRWRGAAPIQRAIMAGDETTGVSIMQMDEGLDTGPLLEQVEVPITETTTAGALHDELAQVGADALAGVLARLARGDRLAAVEQAADGITYADKIAKREARIDFARPAAGVVRHIHGLSPFPGAWCALQSGADTLRTKFLEVRQVDASGPPGRILDDKLTIACADAAIRPVRLQREGRKPMSAQDFLRGSPVAPGGHAG